MSDKSEPTVFALGGGRMGKDIACSRRTAVSVHYTDMVRGARTRRRNTYLNLARGEGGASVFEDLVQMVSRFN